MKNQFTKIPILLIIFKRPDTTRQIIDILSKVKPAKLYIAADGPREATQGEKIQCTETRKLIDIINWPCDLYKNYSDINLGCDPRVESAIDWFFENEEAGIILEDDCLPSVDFFGFAENLLKKYKDNDKVMMISGNNFQDGKIWGDGSYYFSRYPNTWGWATWRRAWVNYDTKLSKLPSFIKNRKINIILGDKKQKNFWLSFFKKISRRKFTFWDAKWVFSIWDKNGVSITPNTNLVQNIGFDLQATHTFSNPNSSIKTGKLSEIIHPLKTGVLIEADNYIFKRFYQTSFWQKIKYKIKYLIKK